VEIRGKCRLINDRHANLQTQGGVNVTTLLLLMAPSRFHAHYVQTHLLDQVIRAVRAVGAGVDRVALLYPGSDG